jgi:hypothetical protein
MAEMNDRVACQTCGAMILPDTANWNQGRCAVCAKTKMPVMPPTSTFRTFVERCQLVRTLLMLPLLSGWAFARSIWYGWRFPYSVRALKEAVSAAHERPSTVDSYVQGVLRGYVTNAPVFYAFTQNDALLKGRNDGGRLRRGEIVFEDIPTQHVPETANGRLILWVMNRISR